MLHSSRMPVRLRLATLDDAVHFERWDRDPAVIAATTDDPKAERAFDHTDWREEIAAMDATSWFLVAELDGEPFGAMQVIDPALEPTHYWGDVAAHQRAVDIWIGEARFRGQGYGGEMMRLVIDDCFADPVVTAVLIDPLASNVDAHGFYQRLGFEVLERRFFGESDCLVHRLTRDAWFAVR